MPARDSALELARRLVAAGHEALFAGGCVRDRLLGLVPKDYDIATSARPEQVLALFPGANEVGAHFGVVIAKCRGHHVEIATFRTDGIYKDGRREEITCTRLPHLKIFCRERYFVRFREYRHIVKNRRYTVFVPRSVCQIPHFNHVNIVINYVQWSNLDAI